MKIVARVVLLLALLLPAFAGRISAAPLTTKYYSLDLPPGLGSGQRPHETE